MPAAGGHVDAPEFEPAERHLQSAPFLADQVFRGHTVVLEDQLGGVDALVTELFELARGAKAWPLLGDEQAHSPVPRPGLRIRFDEDGEDLAVNAVQIHVLCR